MKSAHEDARVTKRVIAGTAGHIDHGKTALVYALTGKDTDRLPEEKRRGITIDLGFAAMRVWNAEGGVTEVSLIDVPGHHAFIRNMLAGTGGIDFALLVIAAGEGVKAQTEEHVAICELLGIERGLVALTKRDAVTAERLEQTRRSAAALLKGTFLRDAPMLSVSAKTGEGIAELREALAKLAAEAPARSAESVTRLYPDRAFSMRGFGTVVTGTLQSGELRAGSVVTLEPGARRARVRGIQVHGKSVEWVCAPSRVALNLAGVGAAIEPRDIQRGQALVPVETLSATTLADAEITLLADAPTLKHRARVRFHAFTADIGATVLLYEGEALSGGGRGLMRLQLDKPMVLAPGDRFVLRTPSPARTIGGGRVLESLCRRGVRKAEARAWLKALREADSERQIELRVERRGAAGADIYDLAKETGLRAEAVREAARRMVERGAAVMRRAEKGVAENGAAEFVISERALAAAEAALLAQVAEAKNGAVSKAELRTRTRLNETVFALAMQRLTSAGKVEGGECVALAGRGGAVDEGLQRRAAAIEREYAAAGVAPPLLREVMERLKLNAAETREAMTVLLRTKRLVRLSQDDLYIHCEAVAQLSARLGSHRGERFDVARFKSFTGLTRKHAIPLLEYLDRAHVTRNVAGTRVVM